MIPHYWPLLVNVADVLSLWIAASVRWAEQYEPYTLWSLLGLVCVWFAVDVTLRGDRWT